ncbi:hypothetical protein FKM82_014644 [Ascaphus truei]
MSLSDRLVYDTPGSVMYLWLNFDEGNICLFIHIDDFSVVSCAVTALHRHTLLISYHVGIGHNQPILRHDEARASGSRHLAFEEGKPGKVEWSLEVVKAGGERGERWEKMSGTEEQEREEGGSTENEGQSGKENRTERESVYRQEKHCTEQEWQIMRGRHVQHAS